MFKFNLLLDIIINPVINWLILIDGIVMEFDFG